MLEVLNSFTPVFAALSLVIISGLISRFLELGIEKELIVNTLRSFGQLILIGYLLEYIFSIEFVPLFFLVIFIMSLIGGKTVKDRAPSIPAGFWLGSFSILIGAYTSIGLMLALGVISTDPKYIIPLGGMLVGNAMNGCSLSMERLYRELKNNREKIELALSLGATSDKASDFSVKESVKAGMMPMLNFMKIVGLVQLPGAMTGMILAGASPIEAVKLQLIVVYMLLSGTSISTTVAILLSRRKMFNKYHQLVLD